MAKVVTMGEIMLRLSSEGNTRFVQCDPQRCKKCRKSKHQFHTVSSLLFQNTAVAAQAAACAERIHQHLPGKGGVLPVKFRADRLTGWIAQESASVRGKLRRDSERCGERGYMNDRDPVGNGSTARTEENAFLIEFAKREHLAGNDIITALKDGKTQHIRAQNIHIHRKEDLSDGGGDRFDFVVSLVQMQMVQIQMGGALYAEKLTFGIVQCGAQKAVRLKETGGEINMIFSGVFLTGGVENFLIIGCNDSLTVFEHHQRAVIFRRGGEGTGHTDLEFHESTSFAQ